jgi:hypothetical protein
MAEAASGISHTTSRIRLIAGDSNEAEDATLRFKRKVATREDV